MNLTYNLCVHKGRFNKSMANAENELGISHPEVINAHRNRKVYADGYFGCASKDSKQVNINLPKHRLFITGNFPMVEEALIDMISSTVEHETIHHLLWNDNIPLLHHHTIISRITFDDDRKRFYSYNNPVFPQEIQLYWLGWIDYPVEIIRR